MTKWIWRTISVAALQQPRRRRRSIRRPQDNLGAGGISRASLRLS